jgi:hypothetical protein
MAAQVNTFPVPMPLAAEQIHEQQQEDYLWGV